MLPIVVAIVIHAVWRIGSKTLKNPAAWVLAAAAFVALGLIGIGFPWIIGGAIMAGLAATRLGVPLAPVGHGAAVSAAIIPVILRAELRRLAGWTALFLALWAVPVRLTLHLAGPQPFADIAAFFTKAAFFTFGGAYAVLPFVAQGAVEHYGWLSRPEMVHGLALAETTPGPLILVTQYVGFFAGWNAAVAGTAATLSPIAAAAVAAALTTWVTFLPCFYFVLIGAPWVERLAAEPRARAALSGVMSAVVGVIATLALSIAQEAFLPAARLDPLAAVTTLVALALIFWFKVGPMTLVLAGAGLGVARGLLGLV